ncbi:MAG: hypothetical protein Q9202_007446 [Teloschistes flavicans]
MANQDSPGKFWNPRSGSDYKSWLDRQLILRDPEEYNTYIGQQTVDPSSWDDDQTHKAKLKGLPRLQTAAATMLLLKENVKRSAVRLRQGSWANEEDSQKSSWSSPRIAVSGISAYGKRLKQRLRYWSHIKQDNGSFQSDSDWQSGNWESGDWETSDWETRKWETSNRETGNRETSNWEINGRENDSWNLAATNEPHQGDYTSTDPKPLDFIAPIPESSLSNSSQEEGFLHQFLSKRRCIDIHPERKHKLAMFLHRMCEEASFAYVSLHEPLMLSILRVHAADQVELSVWMTVVGNLRRVNKSLADGLLPWPNPSHRTNAVEKESDNVSRLRQVAVHRWDYTSKLVEDVVEYLGMLHDTSRRGQVEDALEELYHDECARHSNQDTIPNRELASTVPAPPEEESSCASSITLLNEDPSGDTPTPVRSSPNEVLTPKQQHTFLAEIACTPKIAMPSHVATYQQLLRSCQDILEKALFNFARQHYPSALLRHDFQSAAQVELNKYPSLFDRETVRALPNLPERDVRAILTAGARFFRNAGAHHHEYQHAFSDASSSVQLAWTSNDDDDQQQQQPDEAISTPPAETIITDDRNKQLLKDAQALATMIGDDEAVRKLQLLSWAADINIRAANEVIQDEEARRSVEEWGILEQAARVSMRDFECAGEFIHGWREWLFLRLEGNGRFFREQGRKLGEGAVEVSG